MGYVVLQDGPTGNPLPAATYGGPSGPTGTPGETLSQCSKATISFWFRVPGSTVDACLQVYKEWFAKDKVEHDAGRYGERPPPFNGIIPLLTFGKDTKFKSVGIKVVPATPFNYVLHQWLGSFIGCRWDDRGIDPVTPVLFQQEYDDKFNYTTSPSYIGVDVKPMYSDDPLLPGEPLPKLVFCIQTQDTGETSGATNWLLHQQSNENTDADVWSISAPSLVDEGSGCEWPAGHLVPPTPPQVVATWWLDPISSSTQTVTVEPKLFLNNEVFQTLPGPYIPERSKNHSAPVEPDRWHHILLSFDLTPPCVTKGRMVQEKPPKPAPPGAEPKEPKPGTIQSAPQLYIALDGKNLTKKKLSHYWPKTGGLNDFISVNAKMIYDINVLPFKNGLVPYNGGGTEQYRYVEGQKAGEFSYQFKYLNMLPLGLPSLVPWVSYVRHVEMAELQIFPGIVLDTSVKTNREPFIRNGKPVAPDQKPAEGNGWHPGSIAFLGVEPEVLLHKTRKWQKGDNTGDGGEFMPVGDIEPYKPDPSLGGPQGETQ